MSPRLTKAQRKALDTFAKHPRGGWGFRRAHCKEDFAAPVRRLIVRGFIEKTGTRGTHTVWQITAIGRAALLKALESLESGQ